MKKLILYALTVLGLITAQAGIIERIVAAVDSSGATDPAATGGDYVFKDGNDYIHVFSSVGQSKPFTLTQNRIAEILVVGGGQGGAKSSSGTGGNAGEFTYVESLPLSVGAYTVIAGAGGAGGSDKDTPGQSGGESSFAQGDNVIASAAGGSGTAYNNGAGGSGAGGSGSQKSGYNGGAGGAAMLSDILGWTEAFAGGGGGGSQYATEGAGGSASQGGTTWTVGGSGGKGNGSGNRGANGTGSGGGGAAVWTASGGYGGSGIVIIRISKTKVVISGEITMPDWMEGETASEPSGLTVTPAEAASAFSYKYYADADCTQVLSSKPSTKGVYYVRGEVTESDSLNPAVSAPVQFKIFPSGGGKEFVDVPKVTTVFVYDGTEKVPVAAGAHYAISGDTAKTLAGDYTVTLTLEDDEKYLWSDTLTSDPKAIAWSVTQAMNEWTVVASISKASWESAEQPGVITPPVAKFGNPKVQIAANGGEFTDWNGMMPTEKGFYTIRWTVGTTDSYTGIESAIEFLIGVRYSPTAPFMYSVDGETTWKPAQTLNDAITLDSPGGGFQTRVVEVCEDVELSSFPTIDYRHVTLRSNRDLDQRFKLSFTGKGTGFLVRNGSSLTFSNLIFELHNTQSGLVNAGVNGGTVFFNEGFEVFGEAADALVNQNASGNSKKAQVVVNGGVFRNLTVGKGNLISIGGGTEGNEPVFKAGFITNCTVGAGAVISIGNGFNVKFGDIVIRDNITLNGAIENSYRELTNDVGVVTNTLKSVVRVSGNTFIKGNKDLIGAEKNIVLKNAANLVMTDALGSGASIGVSFGGLGDVFGSFTKADPTKDDQASACRFFNDAKPSMVDGRVDRNTGKLYWHNAAAFRVIVR